MVDLARQGLTTASVGKGGWVDEAAKGGNTRAQCMVWMSGGRMQRGGLPGVVLMVPDEREHSSPFLQMLSYASSG